MSLASLALAQADVGPVQLTNPLKYNTFTELISGITQAFIAIIAVIGGLMLAIAGVLFVTSSGNESRLKKAKDAFWFGVVGVAIALGGAGLISVIDKTINK